MDTPNHHFVVYFSSESGQVLLIVVLVMVVALTVGLSVASRSIIHQKTSTEEVDSQKAFSAAEAGIEEALQNPNSPIVGQNLGNTATIANVSVNTLGGTNNFLMNNGETIHQDEGGDVWLTTYDSDPSKIIPNPLSIDLSIYWGDSNFGCGSPGNNAALEVIVLTKPSGNYNITHYAYDSCSRSNNFSAAAGSGTVGGVNFANHVNINGIKNGLFARVVPIYSSTVIGVTGNTLLPQQGTIITSTGTAGSTQRKVTLFQAYESLPTEFFYTLFSP